MIDYKFTCPLCKNEAKIIERATVIRDTELIGFYDYEGCGGPQPEFALDEEFDDDQSDSSYICSWCEEELDVGYEQLYDYIKKHGEILGAEENAED